MSKIETVEQLGEQLENQLNWTTAASAEIFGAWRAVVQIANFLQGLGIDLRALDQAAVEKLVCDLYCKYVKPLPIPGLPGFLVPLAHQALERFLLNVVRQLFEES